MFSWKYPPMPQPPRPTEGMNYRFFRERVFNTALAAGVISPMLPPDIVDRWLDRMWLVVNKPLDKDELELRRKGLK